MSTLDELEPRPLWSHFGNLCRIPRVSGNEQGAADYVTGVAQGCGCSVHRDCTGNVIVTRAASPGYEQTPALTLQGHLDMVGQKNDSSTHDFAVDPIVPGVANDWVHAEGTTLGADNGIGVAALLSLLEEPPHPHPPLQGIFTVQEETGLCGARGLEPGSVKGKWFLNLDSSQEGEICIGCAGGCDVIGSINYTPTTVPEGSFFRTLAVRGLQGGHSGVDINRGRGNAIKLLGRVLLDIAGRDGVLLCSLNGGTARNAIPREAVAHLALHSDVLEQVIDRVWVWQTRFGRELSMADPDVRIEFIEAPPSPVAFEPCTAHRLLQIVAAIVHGPIRMSTDTHATVETSNTLAVIESTPAEVRIECLVRSLLDTRKEELAHSIRAVLELGGGDCTLGGDYPGWTPNPSSPLIPLVRQVYQDLHGLTVEATIVHAGLECGIIGALSPGIQMVSLGPTIRALHSPQERVNIGSVHRLYAALCEIVRRLGELPA